MNKGRTAHSGRFSQTFIYLGKLFRMFIFQSDWKVLPMAALIAGLVSYVVGANVYKTMEGTLIGTFAMACICIWNGFFNSIQVICRERDIIKREHRSGMHITSYVASHMIYQAFLCLCQSAITLWIFSLYGIALPQNSVVSGNAVLDNGITLFLITYCADMMALMVSALVRSTTTAMTIMPFLLIFQLVFAGAFFQLNGGLAKNISNVTISKWGFVALCSQGDYNSLPMVSVWNSLNKMKNTEYEGMMPVQEALIWVEENGMKEELLDFCGKSNQNPLYANETSNILRCWSYLILNTLAYVIIAVISLEFIDRDKR